ncbi:expressed unknown protein [Seminavis robusta]|uniref:Uncharacterized protein n=1 Tax=Seminavis robusta TaxID=568900 RepID=A0A9N8E0A1_9STRA|nr:expressed unknown protein [Seminavis robusta]|eukprot:Sro518_g158790.1 n/a (2365) ;mRNA; f:19175-27141
MKSGAGGEGSSSKKTAPKSRDKGKSSSGTRRKTSDGPPSSRSKETTSLSALKTSGRRSSKTGDETASAFSGGSGGSKNRKGAAAASNTRTRSPPRDADEGNVASGSLKKKGSTAGRRKSGNDGGFTPDATSMWDAPSFFGSSTKNEPSSFAASAFDTPGGGGGCGGGGGSTGDLNDAAFADSTFFSPAAFGDDTARKTDKKSLADFDPQNTFSSDSAFGSASSHRSSLDMTPIKDPPRRKVGKLSLVKRTVFPQHFACQPVMNPANGNMIFCTSRDGEMLLVEVDPSRNYVQVLSSPILTPELHRKVTNKYSRSAYGIDNVLKLCVGMHQSHGQPRVRIVAVIDLLVLDSKHILRAIAVWQWGYGTSQPVALQFLLSPPSGTDYAYDPESILAADNLVFVAGASAKGPCVFMCKPSVRESWSANFLGPSGKITSMAVTSNPKRKHPYLAVGMADGSLSVWSYAVALRQAASKKNEPFRRLLYPLCRLDALWVLKGLQPTNFAEEKRPKGDVAEQQVDAGICTSLQWLPPQPACSSLLLLAAGFQGGFAVFHVALPLVADEKTGKFSPSANPQMQSTQLAATPQIHPFSAVRLSTQQQDLYVSWVSFGPHNNPCLSLLMHKRSADDEPGRIVLGAINVTEYRKGSKPKESLASFKMLATMAWRSKSKAFPSGLLPSGNDVLYHSAAGVAELHPSFSSSISDPTVQSLKHPVFSHPPGVDSMGEVLGTDTTSDKEGVLHVFSVNQSDWVESDSDEQPKTLHWSRPARRHWLCRTLCGDRKETQPDEEANQFDDDEEHAVGGGVSSVICELESKALSGLSPCRIVRCRGTAVVAVPFRPALGHHVATGPLSNLSSDCVSIALVEEAKAGPASIEVVEGRDVVFVPSRDSTIRSLVLGRDGSSLSCYQKTSSGWDKGKDFRPILGVDADDSFVEAQRVFFLKNDTKHGLAVVGKRYSDGLTCILCGPWGGADQISGDSWTALLPELSPRESCLWLDEGEDIQSIISLPNRPDVSPKFAVSTTRRVLILSSTLSVLAESTMEVNGAMAPLGSSAVAFSTRDARIRYLCCLRGKLSSGIIVTLPTQLGSASSLLLALRSDRILYLRWHSGSSLIEFKDDPNSFLLPMVSTKPVLVLEPLVANAICEGATNGQSTELLRLVIERFGRKVSSISHGEEEGVGNKGSAITPRVYELLSKHGLKHASSWLLTGSVQFDRSTNSKILPPWIPNSAKKEAAYNGDALLHLVANGDQYLSEYVRDPDPNRQSNLPRCADSTSFLCREFGLEALANGQTDDAFKMLDLVGSESTECMLLQLSLLRAINSSNETELFKALSGFDTGSLSMSSKFPTATASMAAVAASMAAGGGGDLKGWMKPLAPSLQKGTHFQRSRQRLLEERALSGYGSSRRQSTAADRFWQDPCSESKHIWNEGPGKEKENLLVLDSVEDWLGRRQPLLLGKAGVKDAEERGEVALAKILKMDEKEDDEAEEAEDADAESDTKGWDDRVGEGREDEENLSGYFRFWEGEDDEIAWRTEGFTDLSRFQCKANVVGQGGALALQPTTSSVDEGEEGKVKPLYDLVFEDPGDEEATGLAIAATRGSSIDVGILHQPERGGRQRCTLEFWYYLPTQSLTKELVLARRSMGADADDFSKVCIASNKRSMLWDLVLLKSGELEVRTCGGTVLRSTSEKTAGDDEETKKELVSFERWNHVCVAFSSKGFDKISKCTVSLYMMGIAVGSAETSMLPPEPTAENLGSKVDKLMEKSHLVFGLTPIAGFRLTEIRVWACERSEDDIKRMLREYLDAAEVRKKKFRVKIGKKGKGGLAPPKSGGKGFLAPPKSSSDTGSLSPPKGELVPPKSGGLAPPKSGGLAPPKSFLPPPKGGSRGGLLAPPKDRQDADSSVATPIEESSTTDQFGLASGTDFEATFGTFGSPDGFQDADASSAPNNDAMDFLGQTDKGGDNDASAWGDLATQQAEEPAATPKKSLWDSAIQLSQQVRSSAAAALIRGPPATRHFGGNRGGLPDLRGRDRYGVGGIAICGSEKTIVWRDEEEPPALTYPIGASGAIVSDQLDDEEGSEFLCCFLAKDKRMVVFELNSRTVVVELQMTTKLNFWRFLPPEAGESTLCFMLITPVGGFHWMPLDDSPRPRQVWKRGSDLQGKKIVSYEEGGSNGLAGPEMISRVGLICVTDSNGTGTLEAWIVPICGDSSAVLVSNDVQGAAFCVREGVAGDSFLPHLALVVEDGDGLKLSICSVLEGESGSVDRGTELTSIPLTEPVSSILEPPTLAMGVFPSSLVCTLGSYVVVLVRASGTMLAYELRNDVLELVASESIEHYVVDAVMRYSAIEGGVEIVMLLSDRDNSKDGRIACYNFRSQA